MLAETITHAVTMASRCDLPKIAGTVWKAHAAGLISDDAAQALAEAIEARKVIPPKPKAPPRRVGSRPKSAASLDRRRRWVASGLFPPSIAATLTMGEAAALAVIAAEVSKRGACTLTIGAVAGAAGVSETTARNGIRAARDAGLITVRERRLSRWRNDSNVIVIVSLEWLSWLRIGEKGGGCRIAQRTPTKIQKQPFAPFKPVGRKASRGVICEPSSLPHRGLRGLTVKTVDSSRY